MPPQPGSRYQRAPLHTDAQGRPTLGTRTPLTFIEDADTRTHEVVGGDTLWALAGVYYRGTPNACSLWWAIAEFQRPRILDPTRSLTPGAILDIPSLALIRRYLVAM